MSPAPRNTDQRPTWVVALGDPAASAWITGQVLTIDGGDSLT